MLTAIHRHALIKTKGKKLAKLERTYYSQYVLKFNLRSLFYVLEFNIRTLRTYIKFKYVKQSTYIKFEYLFRVVRKKKVCKAKVRIQKCTQIEVRLYFINFRVHLVQAQ